MKKSIPIKQGWTKSLRDSFSLVSFGRYVLDTTTCRGGRGAMAGMGVGDIAVDMWRCATYARSLDTVCCTGPAWGSYAGRGGEIESP
jgi:hypothetical protein